MFVIFLPFYNISPTKNQPSHTPPPLKQQTSCMYPTSSKTERQYYVSGVPKKMGHFLVSHISVKYKQNSLQF